MLTCWDELCALLHQFNELVTHQDASLLSPLDLKLRTLVKGKIKDGQRRSFLHRKRSTKREAQPGSPATSPSSSYPTRATSDTMPQPAQEADIIRRKSSFAMRIDMLLTRKLSSTISSAEMTLESPSGDGPDDTLDHGVTVRSASHKERESVRRTTRHTRHHHPQGLLALPIPVSEHEHNIDRSQARARRKLVEKDKKSSRKATDAFYAGYVSFRSVPVSVLLARSPHKFPLTVTSIGEVRQ